MKHDDFIQSVLSQPPAPLSPSPPDPGELFEGIECADNKNRDELCKQYPTLCTHDPHLFKDHETGYYYTSASGKGGNLRRSKDLIHWEYVGMALPVEVPEEAIRWCTYIDGDKPRSIWAPEVHYVGNKYRMYYSSSTFGRRLSYLGMAEAEHACGPYVDKDAIVKTTEASPVNAIDGNLIVEHGTGRHFLNFGSFWGGIRQIELDPVTGLRLDNGQPEYGRPLWARHHRADRSIEGSYEIYHPETGYYYLFVSYDVTFKDYNIRVARSRNVSGPFVDHHGIDVSNPPTGMDPDEIGLKIVDCHQFEDHFGWAATGHNGVMRDGDRYFISYHSHPTLNMKGAAQHVRLMLFDRDGWPVVSPCQYAGEQLMPIDAPAIPGVYERICLDKPDGSSLCRLSRRMYLRADGKALIDGEMGSWRMVGEAEIELTTPTWTDRSYVLSTFDVDNRRPTLVMTGRRTDGICTWAKKRTEVRHALDDQEAQ